SNQDRAGPRQPTDRESSRGRQAASVDRGRDAERSQPLQGDRHRGQDGGPDGAGGDGRQRARTSGGGRDQRCRRGARLGARHGCARDGEVDRGNHPALMKGELVRVRSRRAVVRSFVGLALVLALLTSLGAGGAAAKGTTSNITGLTVFAAASLTDVLPAIDKD